MAEITSMPCPKCGQPLTYLYDRHFACDHCPERTGYILSAQVGRAETDASGRKAVTIKLDLRPEEKSREVPKVGVASKRIGVL